MLQSARMMRCFAFLTVLCWTFDAPGQVTEPGGAKGQRIDSFGAYGNVDKDLRALLREPQSWTRFRQPSQRPAGVTEIRVAESPFVSALRGAWKKGVIEQGIEGYTEVLIQCQKEQSIVLTIPFMRSDSQQAHCYRF